MAALPVVEPNLPSTQHLPFRVATRHKSDSSEHTMTHQLESVSDLSNTTYKPSNNSLSPTCKQSILTRLDHACLNLPPSFFALNMGIGITSILRHNLPYNARWLQIIGTIIFVLLVFGNVIRYIRFKGLFGAVGNHLVSGMFWGCLSMGFTTIVVGLDQRFLSLKLTASEYDRVCLRSCLGLPMGSTRPWSVVDRCHPLDPCQLWHGLHVAGHLQAFAADVSDSRRFTRHTHTPESISAALLLPIVSSVVASALTQFNPSLARSTIIVSYLV